MIVVLLVVETLYKNIWREIEKTGQKKKTEYAMKLVSLLYRFRIDIRRKVFAPILEQLGGNLRLLVGGGAYLVSAMIKVFEIWGINIVQGYGDHRVRTGHRLQHGQIQEVRFCEKGGERL